MALRLQQITPQEWQELEQRLSRHDPEDYSLIERTPGGGDTEFSNRLSRALDKAGWRGKSFMGESGPTKWDNVAIRASEHSLGAVELSKWMRERGLTVDDKTVARSTLVEIELWRG